ncbi:MULTISPECIES: ArsR/SmtB family transcription factor [unclassified Pantoea]|uniref:ArsR/SmtB family transcription factor n=1 Tax=unclassified Pantoea TaxID=2630326 RepID=UPI001CD5A0B7|nr:MULTISPECIES: metalloregulator ArsR/SmtB family transcription factor [unclassified Pantoea]MCA1177767.1 metalloregulator ArsR/SmtB family transcription factor [Pantoea sp. alder69]MCA1252762.1 metalloregulator ArsR/SmtB family transcription factor [Pantoea sp. alder70]MCA1266469.1 metalloregulator ArsR/SmtB family transcription factor [Pantoea sp. alder81]
MAARNSPLIADEASEHELQKAMSAVASALADPSRVSILCALMDGRAWTATELSGVADIAASTTSGHLSKLLDARLVTCLSQGRHRYFRLANSEIAHLLETLMGVSMRPLFTPVSTTPSHLRYARTCYDHLAGDLAVQIYQFMMTEKWIETDGSALTHNGQLELEKMGMQLKLSSKRKPCCACLDWSERRMHLGGAVGAALLSLLIDKQWLKRVEGYREINITPAGKLALQRCFGVQL